jgi:transcriptional regulator with XRE-family HTH domain
MIFNSNLVRDFLKEVIKEKSITIAEIERRTGLTRLSFRNFIEGKVKEPRADVLLSVAKFLDIDLYYLYELASFDPSSAKVPLINFSTKNQEPCNIALLQECVTHITNTLNKKKISLPFEQIIQLIKKLFHYCEQYTKGKLDESFINWQIDQLQ